MNFLGSLMRYFGWLIGISLFCLWLTPSLASWDYFVDGLTYASVSRNLSIGVGEWWDPFYTSSIHPHFREQPPLYFWLLSYGYDTFGDSMVVERAFNVLLFALQIAIVSIIWFQIFGTTNNFLPILLLATMPKYAWAFRSGVLETLLGTLTLAAILFFIFALKSRSLLVLIVFSLASGLCCFLATLTKGPVGVFPLATPVLFLIRSGRAQIHRILISTLFSCSLLIFCYLWLFELSNALQYFSEYLESHLLPVLAGSRTDGTHAKSYLYFLKKLFEELLIPLGFLIFVSIFAQLKHITVKHCHLKDALFFIALGLGGSIPLLVSDKFRAFYLVPSLPLYALGLAILIQPYLQPMHSWIKRHSSYERLRLGCVVGAGLVLLGTLGYSGTLIAIPRKDHAYFQLIESLKAREIKGNQIRTDPSLMADWSLHAYMQRHLRISLSAKVPTSQHYFIVPAGSPVPAGYFPLDLPIDKYDVFFRQG